MDSKEEREKREALFCLLVAGTLLVDGHRRNFFLEITSLLESGFTRKKEARGSKEEKRKTELFCSLSFEMRKLNAASGNWDQKNHF